MSCCEYCEALREEVARTVAQVGYLFVYYEFDHLYSMSSTDVHRFVDGECLRVFVQFERGSKNDPENFRGLRQGG